MRPSGLLRTLITISTLIIIVIGVLYSINDATPNEKTELELLTRQVRGISYLLIGFLSIYLCPSCFDMLR